MKQVFIVEGSTGEYSDHARWFVCAHLDEVAAKEQMHFLNSELERLGISGWVGDQWDLINSASPEMLKHDKGFRCDHTGATYSIRVVELMG